MGPSLLRRLYAAVFAAVLVSAPIAAHAMGDEEFVGPFASWANVKTKYGAAGNGVTDDTAAIQKALDALGSTNPTLYFPAGTYRIAQTLNLAGQGYVNVIGEDPGVTTIIWGGTSGGTMLYLNGVMYSRFNRLTFDGQSNAAVAVDQSWDNVTGQFDTGNEYADDVFKNAGTGLRCGNRGAGCAETSMLRDQFLNNSVAGVAMKNFNALDMFIWHSLFQNNREGVTNNPGAGNFHVYGSVFQNSSFADIEIGNTGTFSFRHNYSSGSNIFLNTSATNNPALITLQGNTILDATCTTCGRAALSVYVGNFGPIVLLDNVIRTKSGVTAGPVILGAGLFGSFTDFFSMGNTFTVTSPISATGRLHSVQDQTVARNTVNPSPPTLPGTPPNYHRQIFEVTPGATAAQIQQVINTAAASGTVKPVVHIQPGSYSINATLLVPANSDVQIIGDGYYSRLTWTGSTPGPVLRLQGPSKATLRDFSVSGNQNSADGIEVVNADQPGSRVFMEQATLGLSRANLLVAGLDHTNVELHNFYHSAASTAGTTSVTVTGGPSAAQGLWQGGTTNIFAGASAGNYLSYGVSNGAHVGIRDIWYDAGAGGNLGANVTGTGIFTYAGSALYIGGNAPQAISLNNFQGKAALLNLSTNGDVKITGDSSDAQLLGLGLVGPFAKFFANTASPAATTAFMNGQTTANPPLNAGSSELADLGPVDAPFLTATLEQIRTEQPTLLAPLPSGVTDIRFYRVFVDSANVGIRLEAGSVALPPPREANAGCGASNGRNLTRAPTTGLCNTGTASAVSGSGPWSWSCTSSNGGSTASCSAQLTITRPRYVR